MFLSLRLTLAFKTLTRQSILLRNRKHGSFPQGQILHTVLYSDSSLDTPQSIKPADINTILVSSYRQNVLYISQATLAVLSSEARADSVNKIQYLNETCKIWLRSSRFNVEAFDNG